MLLLQMYETATKMKQLILSNVKKKVVMWNDIFRIVFFFFLINGIFRFRNWSRQ